MDNKERGMPIFGADEACRSNQTIQFWPVVLFHLNSPIEERRVTALNAVAERERASDGWI